MRESSRRGERLYRALLSAYPRRFRDRHGDELLELFRYRRDERLAAKGGLGPGFWGYISRDLAGSAWRERRRPLEERGTEHRSGGDGMRGWRDDLVYAGRRLARSPGFAATALVILVLGIGVNTTAFSLVNALLFQPPPFEDPERVVLVLQDDDTGTPSSTSYPAFLDVTRFTDVFDGVSAFSGNQAFMEQDDGLAPVLVEYATSTYLDVIGLSPSRGVWFDALADDPTGPPAAVLSHKMWSERLGRDPDVLGSTLRIGGSAVTVVGVGPEAFNGGAGPAAIDLWLSISAMRPTGGRAASLTRRQDHPFQVRARLAPGVSIERASSAMERLAEELATTYPTLNADRRITVLPTGANGLPPQARGEIVPAATLTMVVVALVLVIGTLNLANLLFVRSMSRSRELAVRLALGANRGRLVRVVLSEALLLSAIGGAGGLATAVLATNVLRKSRIDLGLPLSLDIRLDAGVLLFTVAISLLAGLVFGLVPALRATSRRIGTALRDEAGAVIGARRRFGLTGALVATQITASLLLLAVAGVFLESFVRAQTADPGFELDRTGFVQVGVAPLGLDGEANALLYEQLEERLAALPEVSRVTTSLQLPAAMFGTTTLLLGSGLGGVDAPTEIPWNLVGRSYFDVMGIGLLHGRLFDADDEAGGPSIAIVSEAMARTYWGRSDVVGEVYRSESRPEDPVEIVGVVEDATVRALGEAPTPMVYWPRAGAFSSTYFVVEAAGAVPPALTAARAAIMAADSRILVFRTRAMREHVGDSLERQRLAGTLLGGFGALALLLAVLGVYGVVSYAVSRRRHEVGIRIALGAGRPSVVRLFVRDVSAVVVVGAVAGLGLAIPAMRVIGAQFTGSAGSPLVTGAVGLILVTTALLATSIPAVRATRTDPTEALRQE